jgi:hypothetical protein
MARQITSLHEAIFISEKTGALIRPVEYEGPGSDPGPWLVHHEDGYLRNQGGRDYRLSIAEIMSGWEVGSAPVKIAVPKVTPLDELLKEVGLEVAKANLDWPY